MPDTEAKREGGREGGEVSAKFLRELNFFAPRKESQGVLVFKIWSNVVATVTGLPCLIDTSEIASRAILCHRYAASAWRMRSLQSWFAKECASALMPEQQLITWSVIIL